MVITVYGRLFNVVYNGSKGQTLLETPAAPEHPLTCGRGCCSWIKKNPLKTSVNAYVGFGSQFASRVLDRDFDHGDDIGHLLHHTLQNPPERKRVSDLVDDLSARERRVQRWTGRYTLRYSVEQFDPKAT